MKKQGAKGKNNPKMAPKMPNGTEVVDVAKVSWKIGEAIGSGGFGLIYLTQKSSISGPVSAKAEHVMKLELHDSGPLFCEQAFFQRAGKPDSVNKYLTSRKLQRLGLPTLLGLGSHVHDGEKLRFLVLPRYGTDLQKIFEKNGRRFLPATVFRVGIQVLDVLEYIHSQGYAHADIKAANLMTGLKEPDQVYLIDYGLAFKYSVDGKHKEYKEDPRRAHDGTAEYASRDAHKGVWPSARGDLETLGYCMWQWLVGKLPWEGDVANKPLVAQQKIKYMGNVEGQIAPLIKDQTSSKTLCKYLSTVAKLDYDESPKYEAIKQLFASAVASLKCKLTDKLDFSAPRVDTALLSPVRRSGRMSKVQAPAKPTPAPGLMLKSPPPKSAAIRIAAEVAPGKSPGRQRLFSPSPPPAKTKAAEVVPGKSPGRPAGRQRLLSPSPPTRTKAAGSGDDVTEKKAVSRAPVATGTLKRKRDEAGGDSPQKRKKAAPKIANSEVPVLTPSRLRVNCVDSGMAAFALKSNKNKLKGKEEEEEEGPTGERNQGKAAVRLEGKRRGPKPPKTSSGTQTTPSLRGARLPRPA